MENPIDVITPNIDVINTLTIKHGIQVIEHLANTKASDYFLKVKFTQPNGEVWTTVVPYVYRRSNLNMQDDNEIAAYLIKLKPYFAKEAMENWKKVEWAKWVKERNAAKNPEKLVTINFFEVLLSFKEENEGFPANTNPQRRFQDIKDRGYTVSIYPIGDKKWGKVLLPIPLNEEMGYENFAQIKSRIIRLFKGINAYEAKVTAVKSLIPDHKFSEVRWDDETKGENPMDMTDEEIIAKFQLLDNQRNQQKREVCRQCYQTGERGKLFGIDFYPKGGPKWDDNIPKVGKAAEAGCEGCPWYDIEAWRKAINEKLNKK